MTSLPLCQSQLSRIDSEGEAQGNKPERGVPDSSASTAAYSDDSMDRDRNILHVQVSAALRTFHPISFVQSMNLDM